MAAFLGPLIAGIAKAGAGLFARAGAKSVAAVFAKGGARATAARGAAGTVGRVAGGQTVLEGESWKNARMFTKALDLAKRGGGTVRQVITQGREAAAAAAPGRPQVSAGKGSPAVSALREAKETLSSKSRESLLDYVKGLRKGTIPERHKRMTEAGQMLSMHEVPKRPGQTYPGKKQMVQATEQSLTRAKTKELRRLDVESAKQSYLNNRLATATTLLVKGPASLFALGKAIDVLTRMQERRSQRYEIWSGLITSEMHLTKLTQLFADMRSARMTEGSFATLSASRRRVTNAWQRPGAETTKLLNTVSSWGNNILAGVGWVATAVIEVGDKVGEFMGLVAADQQDGQMPQQQFRNYWAAMAAGDWEKELPPLAGPRRGGNVAGDPLSPPLDPRNPLGGFLGR